jgi:DNA-binding CsgD family transcriptional regulator
MAILRGSARQVQILELVAQGQSDKEIAVALGISVHTVRSHMQRLYRTHGLTNRAEAVAMFASQETAAVPMAPPDPDFEDRLAAAAQVSAAAHLAIQTADAQTQVELVNHERETSGLAPVEWNPLLADVATVSARQMAEQGYLSTVIGSLHGPDDLEIRAENVGYWPGVNDLQLHGLFIADPKQRANILGPHRGVGAAWATTEAGVSFLSVVFA